MNLGELAAKTAATLKALETSKDPVDPQTLPYFGYYTADIFDCPPFLMFTNNDCPRAWDILYHRSFEPGSMKIWCRLAKTATGILDLGAHVGVYSLAAAALRQDISIHAFEPNPHAYTRLRMHKVLNGFGNIVEHWYAVGHEKSYVHFSWHKKATLVIASGAGIGKRPEEVDSENIVVPMKKLDDTGLAATLGARPLIKIDVEGAEALALSGMREILELRPDILLETFGSEACDEINPMIARLGYRVYGVREKARRLVRQEGLLPCDLRSENFNQFLTAHGEAAIEDLIEPSTAN